MKSFIKAAATLALAPLCAPLAAQEEPAAHHQHATDEDLATARQLMAGGNVVFFRHERTEVLRPDDAKIDLSNCSTQRNLSIAGIANSQQTGEYIRHLGIRVDKVRSSAMCRSLETARYAFGDVDIEERLFTDWTEETRDGYQQAEDFRALVAEYLEPGKNTVLVGHFPGGEAYGVRLEEGDALVLTGGDRGGVRVVGVMGAHRWGDVIRDLGMDR